MSQSTPHASKDSLDAMKENDRRAAGSTDAVPGNDNEHAHSAAAHLDEHVHEHTKPAGNLRQGTAPGERREPPQEVSRVGKEHR